jgi:lipid II:glycine glycyltransferase (peptidoglycan interpeptide bridge formation enzyme)
VASKDGRPVASLFTLDFKSSIVFKYACCDARFNRLGGMPFLFWETIQRGKLDGFDEIDLGRSDRCASGLIAFKDRWGSRRSLLPYMRYPASSAQKAGMDWKMRLAKPLFAKMPDTLLIALGDMFYKHVG